MKKMILYCLFVVIPNLMYGQTLSAEKRYINSLIKLNNGSPEVIQKNKDWNAFLKDNPYPDFKWDSVHQTQRFRYTLPLTVSKQKTYERTRQWIAVSFKDADAVTKYENLEEGVLIVKGWQRITYVDLVDYGWLFGTQKQLSVGRLWTTVIVKIDAQSVELELRPNDIEFDYGGFFIGESYQKRETVSYSPSSVFPLLKNDAKRWQGIVNMMREIESAELNTSESFKLVIKQGM